MITRRVLGTLAAVAALAAVAVRRRAVAGVPPELRHPALYLPLNVTNAATLAVGRRLRFPGARIRPGVRVERRTVPAGHGHPPVGVVVYRRAGSAAAPGALLWIHGGGMVLGTPAIGHAWCSRVAAELGLTVVSVDYRLAPEHPFPAGLDDCYRVLRWLHDEAPALGIDPARIAVGGDSAGGGLAATLAQRARDTGVAVRLQLLVYPMLDDRTVLRERPDRPVFTWTPASNRYGWTAYLGHPPHEDDDRPYIAAARRTDLTGLAPAWIGVGDLDLFHREDVGYAHRLREAGVPCELLVVPGMYHGADALFDRREPTMTAFRTAMLKALLAALTDARPAGSPQ
ncbi:alpha/beta hydrolase [Couchioplanes caeruleus]|uniref:Arylesterase n=2 Tax=Couchioplanes caeruleus TaxID=56438 RepID=A0A1K0GZZ4_9ACTN|nr:alpha/beta hydrolase [Couchioplanes caeruleus]OJF15003.1 arylesterase [Couchioplanes caeruleus subsp. caeruleus]ROP28911.1 acetyl esterase/lipase [Couchioplanes caeruleus]